ncbi:hypothetical protein FJY63_08360, partial [Candidatus Sumerlaeota bacterium]|nr:hypothetical protein [Candidatus Sumerlaeota bacterium]
MSRSTHNRKRCGFGKKRQPQPAFRAAREHWRSVLELERGTPPIVPPAECQVALVYPNTYAVGMSSLGYQMVYRWINDQPGALAERFFCGENSTVSVENQRPIERFDLVAFSIAYELDYLGVVRFLLENSITPIAAQRDPSAQPIVVAGGICLLINRLPIHDLADVLVVGDGEQTVTRLVGEWVASGGQRLQFLKAIQSLEGVEVTEGACQRFGLESSPTPVRPHVAEALDAATHILPL